MAKNNNAKMTQLDIEEQYQTCKRASFFRRLGAYIYDLFTISVVVFIATLSAIMVVLIASKVGAIDLTLYKGASDFLGQSLVFLIYLSVVIIGFFAYFWSQIGQTFGMKICRIRVQNSDGSNITFTQSLIRIATSAFGLGSFMALLKDRNAFQDLWAECEVVVLPKELSNWKGFSAILNLDKK